MKERANSLYGSVKFMSVWA